MDGGEKLNKEFSKEDIKVNVLAKTREDAIQKSANILIDKGFITQGYVDEMISVLEEYGPYFVLSPGMAFAHSKPSTSVLKSGLSIMTLKEPINFNHEKNDPVFLVAVIASVDSESHLGQLQTIVGFLSESDNVELLKAANSEADIDLIVNRLNKGA